MAADRAADRAADPPAAGPAIGFRPLTRGDADLLTRWLEEPVVARWWAHETTPEAIERDFGPSIDRLDATEMFVAELDPAPGGGADPVPLGMVQRYPIAAYPEYLEELSGVCEVPERALGIDYLIGAAAHRGVGLGAAMIDAFVVESLAAHPTASSVIVPVAAGNPASWRALESAGFERIAEGELEPDNPVDPPDHVIYLRRRP